MAGRGVNYETAKTDSELTSLGVAPFAVVVPGDEPTDVLAADGAYHACKAPAQTHAQLMRAREPGLFLPLLVGHQGLMVVLGGACVDEGVDEALDTRGIDIEGGVVEDEGGGDAAACFELVGQDVDEAFELVEAEDDVSLVAEVAVVVVLFLAFCGETRSLEVEGEKGAVGELGGEVVLDVYGSGGALGLLALFLVLFPGGGGRLPACDPAKLVVLVVGVLVLVGRRECAGTRKETVHWEEEEKGKERCHSTFGNSRACSW